MYREALQPWRTVSFSCRNTVETLGIMTIAIFMRKPPIFLAFRHHYTRPAGKGKQMLLYRLQILRYNVGRSLVGKDRNG